MLSIRTPPCVVLFEFDLQHAHMETRKLMVRWRLLMRHIDTLIMGIAEEPPCRLLFFSCAGSYIRGALQRPDISTGTRPLT
jgi:hypothetical protein